MAALFSQCLCRKDNPMTAADTTPSAEESSRTLSPFQASVITDPYPMLKALQAQGEGVLQEPSLGSWLVTRHDDVDALLRDHSLSRDPRKSETGAMAARLRGNEEEFDPERLSILFLDPPDHTRLRGLVNRAFTPRAVENMRPRAQEIADKLFDAVQDAPCWDLMAAFAAPYPTVVIAEMLGVDPAKQAWFKECSDKFVRTLDPFISEAERNAANEARIELDAYFMQVINERRAQPQDDLITGLVQAQEGGDRLSDAEMLTQMGLLLTAGNVTTTDLIGNGVYALLSNPSELKKLQDDPSLITRAVEEMLRFDSPVIMTGRTPLEERAVGGCPVHAGEQITPMLGAANHDPRAYPDPARFDISREDVHHHSFGGGIHFCLGAPLARLEAQVAISTLLRRFPAIRLAANAQPQRRLLPGFRGFLTLEVETN
jgi:cytochrome P450